MFIFCFSKEVRSRDIADSGDGFEDMHLSRGLLLTGLDEKLRSFFQLILECEEDSDFGFEDIFVDGRRETDGALSSGDEHMRGSGRLSSFFSAVILLEILSRSLARALSWRRGNCC
ncbi:MAG TPA: hypothetical protein VFG01_07885 [Acidobacteriota bacterium]|nr:hypothetical protein [Acidobacteriota bacterium]